MLHHAVALFAVYWPPTDCMTCMTACVHRQRYEESNAAVHMGLPPAAAPAQSWSRAGDGARPDAYAASEFETTLHLHAIAQDAALARGPEKFRHTLKCPLR